MKTLKEREIELRRSLKDIDIMRQAKTEELERVRLELGNTDPLLKTLQEFEELDFPARVKFFKDGGRLY
jgi:hypothetical protein